MCASSYLDFAPHELFYSLDAPVQGLVFHPVIERPGLADLAAAETAYATFIIERYPFLMVEPYASRRADIDAAHAEGALFAVSHERIIPEQSPRGLSKRSEERRVGKECR